MKVPVLKALANPARIFYVPYNLAVLNFILLLLLYVAVFTAELSITGGREVAVGNPLYFMLAAIATHSLLAVWSKKEPFLSRIIVAKLSLFRKNIPNRLGA